MYFTYFHIIFIILIAIFFCLIAFLVLRKPKPLKSVVVIVSSLFVSFLACSALACITLDEYTKVAKITNLQYKRVLVNESMQFSGIVSNVGGFDISYCKLNVRLTNSPSRLQALTPDLFQQQGGFWENFFKKQKKPIISTVNEDFEIAQDLKANSARPFSVYIRYPTTFVEPKVNYTIICH